MKLSIMQKMLLFILMPVILGLAAVTLFNYNAARTALNNQIGEELQLVLSGQKKRADQYRRVARHHYGQFRP